MSRDDSKVQLKSLEQVLRLGQSIAAVESSALAERAAQKISGVTSSPEKKGVTSAVGASPERLQRSPTAAAGGAAAAPQQHTRLNLMAEKRAVKGRESKTSAEVAAAVDETVSYCVCWRFFAYYCQCTACEAGDCGGSKI